MNIARFLMICASGVLFAGCKPADPPPDLVKTQRDAMNKAKAVEGQLQKSADETRKAADQND